MSGTQFNRQAQTLESILEQFKGANKGEKTTQVLKTLIENDFKKPILAGLDSDQRRRMVAIKKALDEFIKKWLDREDYTEEWNHLNALLFPAEE